MRVYFGYIPKTRVWPSYRRHQIESEIVLNTRTVSNFAKFKWTSKAAGCKLFWSISDFRKYEVRFVNKIRGSLYRSMIVVPEKFSWRTGVNFTLFSPLTSYGDGSYENGPYRRNDAYQNIKITLLGNSISVPKIIKTTNELKMIA